MTSVSRKKKIIIIIAAIALIAALVSGILLGIYFGTRKDALDYSELKVIRLDEKYTSDVYRAYYYLGHPDLVEAADGTLITAYPAGHGVGAILMQKSSDYGESWEGVAYEDKPASWEDSQETPTLYRLDMTDGSSKLLLVSGCPSWDEDDEYYANGFNCSVSSDDGKTWTEFENFYGVEWAQSAPKRDDNAVYTDAEKELLPNYDEAGNALPYDVIVAMSSLTRLKENGEYVDKWMGTFHDYDFHNYCTILTFDESGEPVWSAPRKFLTPQRAAEESAAVCEIEIFRAPSDNLILIGRANARNSNSLISVSTDEGATWSEFRELPNSLTGDRHKAEYDDVTGKLLISFRYVLPGMKSSAFAKENYLGGYWCAWIGDAEDLEAYALGANAVPGEALVVLGATNDGKADCGYSGTVCRDGVFVLQSYGKFSKGAKYPYIMQAKFSLADIGLA